MEKYYVLLSLMSIFILTQAQNTISLTVKNETDGQLKVGFGMQKLNPPCTPEKLIRPFDQTVNPKGQVVFTINKDCCGSFPKFTFLPISGSARRTAEYEVTNCQSQTITVTNKNNLLSIK